MVLGNYACTFISYSYKAFGESGESHDPISDSLLTWASSCGAGINGVARIIFGSLADKFSFRALMMVVLCIELGTALVIFPAAQVPALFFVCVLLNYTVVGGFFAIFPVSVTSVFGMEHGPQIYVQILIGSFISSLMNLITTQFILPATSFATMFYIGAGTTFGAMVMLFFLKEELDVDNLAKHNAVEPVPANKQ
mgnify:FL=1